MLACCFKYPFDVDHSCPAVKNSLNPEKVDSAAVHQLITDPMMRDGALDNGWSP